MPSLAANLKHKQTPCGALVPAEGRDGPAVAIEYCVPGNCERIAQELAQAIRDEFGEEVELIPSRDGVFEVTIDGRLVFSKRASRRFPEHDEVFYHVRNRKA